MDPRPTEPTELQWLFDIRSVDPYPILATALGLLAVASVAVAAHLLLRWVVLRGVSALVRKSATWWDDVLQEHHVFNRLALVGPLLVVRWGITLVPHVSHEVVELVQRVVLAVLALVLARALASLANGVNAIYTRYEVARGRPIKSYLQVLQILAYAVASIIAIAALMDESPWFFITGLGAMTAVLLLIFRDTLLSLVAGVQLTNNDLIRVGDWIEVPGFDADGDVIDIALNVVKVQNWDKTVTVIPTHKFLEHSFKNWRGMQQSGGRRIKRSLLLDMRAVRFLTDDDLARLRQIRLLRPYLDAKLAELAEHNAALGDEGERIVNRRALTNLGTFRAYVSAYLRAHPRIHQEMTFLVRQLQPTDQGIPLEVYVFTNDIRWAHYEGIQADIFDHLLAVVPEFGLKVFQSPSGADVEAAAAGLRGHSVSAGSPSAPAPSPRG